MTATVTAAPSVAWVKESIVVSLRAQATASWAAGYADNRRVGELKALHLVGADPNLSHRADRILSQGWRPVLS
jgi:hypothetical protein